MSSWADHEAAREPPRRRFPVGSAEDDCLGLLVQLNAQADAAWLALYDGRESEAERLLGQLVNMALSAAARLEERDRG